METKNLNPEAIFGSQDSTRRWYVYRLVDPRTYQTFYVGKGCGDRVLQQVKNVPSMQEIAVDDEKSMQIAEILAMGKEVIVIIHRRGLTEVEAFEVEAALIDAYPGASLTNKQTGHGSDRGCISLEDLLKQANVVEYDEPEVKYIIIKTSAEAIRANGSLYEATRRSWRADLNKAQKYKYVFSVINGIVREVYKVERWYQYSPDRIAFEGYPTTDPVLSSCKGKLLPAKYSKRGAANPFIYSK